MLSFLKKKKNVYLAGPGLSRNTRDLQSLPWHMGSFAVASAFRFPDQALSPDALRWERRVLGSGLPGKSRGDSFLPSQPAWQEHGRTQAETMTCVRVHTQAT